MAEHATATRERPAAAKPPVSPTRRPSHVGPTPAPFHASRGGVPLHQDVAGPIGRSLGIDVSGIRVHTDGNAAAASRRHGALAFAYGPDIFLGAGQRPDDLPLMAHEVAHVVQQQGAPRVQLWSTAGNDPHEHEAHRASSAVMRQDPFTVRQRTAPQVQRLGISDVLDYFADKANLIPGYRMFTLMIGFNPINMSTVERTSANFLRALIELVPGGGIITQVLDKYGVIDHAGAWIDEQIKSIGISGASIRKAIGDFIDSLGWRDIFHLGDVWDRAKRIFTDPIGRLIDFGRTVIKGVLRFVREAVLAPLGKLAEGTRGWPLLKAVLGEDPITGEAVPRNADTLIGGFMTLIGQQEIWENIKRANAIPRAWEWFQGALSGLMGLVRSIPDRFIAALKDLDFSDFIILPSAFAKLARVFGALVMDFLSWAGNQVLSLLQIIFEVVAPGAMQYVRKAAGAFKEIIRAPIRFVGNLVSAAKLGFQNFASNFLEHLKAGLIDWLTGSLPGLYIPKAFELREILKFALSVLGLTWDNIRGKLVKAIGETAVKALETGFDIVVKLVRDGPAAAWEAIKEQLSNLKDMVIGGITDFVVDTVVKKAIPQLVALFIPGAGFITAIIKIYDTIMVFVEKISKIIQVVTGFIDSIAAIAAGAIGGAAKKVESTLANLLSLAISFLAGFAGLGKVSDKIMGVIQKIRAPIDKALDWLIGWIVNGAKRLGKLVAQAGVPQDPLERVRLASGAAVLAIQRLGRSSTRAALGPVLGAIQVRYGLRELSAFERGSTWWVKASINPDEVKDSKVPTPTGPAPAAGVSPVAWGVDDMAYIRDDGRLALVKSKSPGEGNTPPMISFDYIKPQGMSSAGSRRMSYEAWKANWGRTIKPDNDRDRLVQQYGPAAGNKVANAMENRGQLRDNLKVPASIEAHHLVPVSSLGKEPVLVRLIAEVDWDPHAKVMGEPLPEAFHRSHPAYNRYVERKIRDWVLTQPSPDPNKVDLNAAKAFIEVELVTDLKAKIASAKSSGLSLNDYFKKLP